MPKRARSNSTKKYKGQAFSRSRKMRKASRRRHIKGFRNLKMRARWSGTTWPRMLFKKFEWENTQDVDTLMANSSVAYGYRLNSIYDPDTATQPNPSVIDFSTFLSSTGPYRRYRVMGAKVSARFTNYGGAMGQLQAVLYRWSAVSIDSESITFSGLNQEAFDNLSSLPGGSEPLMIGPLAGGNNIKTKSWYVCPWKVMGVTKADYMSDDKYTGSWSTSPGSICMIALVGLGLPSQLTMQMRLRIVYYVQLLDPYQVVNNNAVTADPA